MEELRDTSRRIVPQWALDAVRIVFANPNSTAAYLIAEAARRTAS